MSSSHSNSNSNSNSTSSNSDSRFKVPTYTQTNPSDSDYNPTTSNSGSNSNERLNQTQESDQLQSQSQSQSVDMLDSSDSNQREQDSFHPQSLESGQVQVATDEQQSSSNDIPMSSTPAIRSDHANQDAKDENETSASQDRQDALSLPPTQSSQLNDFFPDHSQNASNHNDQDPDSNSNADQAEASEKKGKKRARETEDGNGNNGERTSNGTPTSITTTTTSKQTSSTSDSKQIEEEEEPEEWRESRPPPNKITASKEGKYKVAFPGLCIHTGKPWARIFVPKTSVSEELIKAWRDGRPEREKLSKEKKELERKMLEEAQREQEQKEEEEREQEREKVRLLKLEMDKKEEEKQRDLELEKETGMQPKLRGGLPPIATSSNAIKRKRESEGEVGQENDEGIPSTTSGANDGQSSDRRAFKSPARTKEAKRQKRLSLGLFLGGADGDGDSSVEEDLGDESAIRKQVDDEPQLADPIAGPSRLMTRNLNVPSSDLVPVIEILPMKRRRSNRSTSTSTDRSSAVPTPLGRTFSEKGKEVSKAQVQVQSKGTAAERLGELKSRYSKQVDSSKRVRVEESSDDDDDDEPQSSSPRRSPIKKSIIRDSDDEELIPTKTQSQPHSSFDPVLSGTPALASLSTKINTQGKKRGIPQITREAFAPFLTERTGVPLESESLGNRDSMQMQSSEDHRGKTGDPKKRSKPQGQQQQVKGTKLMKLGMPSVKATGNEMEEDEISDDVMSSPIRDFSDEEMLGVQEKDIDLDEDAILAPNSDLSTQEQARLRKSSQVNGLPRIVSSNKKKVGETSRSIDRDHASSQVNGKVTSSLDLSLSHAELRAQPGSPAAKGQVLKLVRTSEHFPYFLRDDVEKYLQKAKIAVPKNSNTNQAHSQSQSQSQSQSVTADESDGFKYLHLKDTWTLQLDEGDASSWGTNEAEAEETVLVLILWMDANTYDVQLISKESLSDLQSKFECDPWVDNNGRDWKGVIRPKDVPRSTSNWSQNHRKNESSMDMESLRAMNASLLLAIEELRKEKTTLAVQRDDAIDAENLLEEEKEEWENLRAEFQEELAASGLTGEGRRALGTESEVKSLVKELKKQLNQTQKDKISALEDVDYFQQEARNATASASNMSIELQAAQAALQKVTRQLEVGLANQRDATKKHRQTLEDKISQLEIQNKILVSQNAKTNDGIRKKAALWDAMEAREKEGKEAERKKKEKVEEKKEQERLEALKELEDEARELQSLAELEGEPIAVDVSSGRASRSRRRGPAPVVESAPPSVAPQAPIAQQLPALVQAQVHQDAPQSNIEPEAARLEVDELPSSHAGQIVEENNPTDLGALASPEISASMEAALQTQVPYPETQMSQIPSSPASLPNSDGLQTQANSQTQASRSTETNPMAAPRTNATPRSSTSSSHNTPLAFGFGFNQAPMNQSRPSFTGFGFSSPSRPFAALRHSFGSNASAQSSTEALVEPQMNVNEAENSADGRREEEKSLEKEDQQQPQGNAWLDNLDEFTQQQ